MISQIKLIVSLIMLLIIILKTCKEFKLNLNKKLHLEKYIKYTLKKLHLHIENNI